MLTAEQLNKKKDEATVFNKASRSCQATGSLQGQRDERTGRGGQNVENKKYLKKKKRFIAGFQKRQGRGEAENEHLDSGCRLSLFTPDDKSTSNSFILDFYRIMG